MATKIVTKRQCSPLNRFSYTDVESMGRKALIAGYFSGSHDALPRSQSMFIDVYKERRRSCSPSPTNKKFIQHFPRSRSTWSMIASPKWVCKCIQYSIYDTAKNWQNNIVSAGFISWYSQIYKLDLRIVDPGVHYAYLPSLLLFLRIKKSLRPVFSEYHVGLRFWLKIKSYQTNGFRFDCLWTSKY